MVFVSGLLADCSHSGSTNNAYQPKAPFWVQRCNETKFHDYKRVQFVSSRKIPSARIQYFHDGRLGSRYATSVSKNHPELRFEGNVPSQPFWLSLIKEVLWALRSLFVFLVEQPSQLNYIEWPGFQSTLKTATLTLVLVALLIVALSSVDAGLSYLLALLLRRIR